METQLVEQMGGHYRRLLVTWEGRPAFAVNEGGTSRDFLLQRPTLHPVCTPAGFTVTEHGPHNHVHHRGVWIGHSRVNGANCFHDGPDCGRIEVRSRRAERTADGVRLDYELRWLDAAGQPLCDERRALAFHGGLAGATAGQLAHRIDIRSTLVAAHGPVAFAKENHAFCGVRPADTIDEDEGGRVVNSHGQAGEAGAMGQVADWVDTSGSVGGHPHGVALLCHPSSPPTPFFVRSYGTVLADIFLREGRELAAGGELTQVFAVLAHDGDAESFGVAQAFAAFAASPAT